MPEYVTADFTLDEIHEVEQALWARLDESRRYAQGTRADVRHHDECCETARARKSAFAAIQVALDKRVTDVQSALSRVLPLCTKKHARDESLEA
jgi:hypothetical protein